ncbi:MAG: hypothetical protein ABI867_23075 [Kofleriaceae bacterium]
MVLKIRWPVLACAVVACGGDPALGPDAAPTSDADLGVDIVAIPGGCTLDRSEDDRPDDHGYDQIRVLYVTASDGSDESHDTNGQICNSIRAVATWFHAQTGSYLRFDTTGGLLDIGFARLGKTDAAMRGTDPANETIETGIAFVRERIERELPALARNKLYAVYYEGTSSYACGGGAYPPVIFGRVGAMYLRAQPPGESVPCGDSRPWGQPSLVPSYVDYGILHELVHSLGLVPDASPNEHSSGHVFDVAAGEPARDLMYSQRPGMPDPFWGVDDPRGLVIDIGNDDYFNAPTPGDLATSSVIAPLSVNAHRPLGW